MLQQQLTTVILDSSLGLRHDLALTNTKFRCVPSEGERSFLSPEMLCSDRSASVQGQPPSSANLFAAYR